MATVFTDGAAKTWLSENMAKSSRSKKKAVFFIFIDDPLQIEPWYRRKIITPIADCQQPQTA
jgi:hypothetical protein